MPAHPAATEQRPTSASPCLLRPENSRTAKSHRAAAKRQSGPADKARSVQLVHPIATAPRTAGTRPAARRRLHGAPNKSGGRPASPPPTTGPRPIADSSLPSLFPCALLALHFTTGTCTVLAPPGAACIAGSIATDIGHARAAGTRGPCSGQESISGLPPSMHRRAAQTPIAAKDSA